MAADAAGSEKTIRLILFLATTKLGVISTMNKQATFLLLSFIALLSISVTVSGAAPKQAPPQKGQTGTQHDLTIFFANDVRGETEPCG